MIRKLTVKEIEAAVTQRVLLDRLADKKNHIYRTTFNYDEALLATKFATNDVLLAHKLNRDLWAKILGRRAFLIHCPTNRIVAELVVMTENAGDGKRRNFQMMMFGRNGATLPEDVASLIIEATKLGAYSKRNNKEKRK